jgi:hypothetical protein
MEGADICVSREYSPVEEIPALRTNFLHQASRWLPVIILVGLESNLFYCSVDVHVQLSKVGKKLRFNKNLQYDEI